MRNTRKLMTVVACLLAVGLLFTSVALAQPRAPARGP
jgi:hypothetical protein